MDQLNFQEGIENSLELFGEDSRLNDAELHFTNWAFENIVDARYTVRQIIIGRRGGKCHDALSIAYSIIDALYGDQE